MKKQMISMIIVLAIILCLAGCAGADKPAVTDKPVETGLTLTSYNGGFFSLTMPEGWTLKTIGEYVDFVFIITNPVNPDMQIFRFGRLQPFLKSSQSKQLWQSLYGTGLFPDAPVMTDRTAGGLLSLWNDCIAYQHKYSSSVFPTLNNINVVSNKTYSGVFSAYGGAESMAVADCVGANGTDCQCILTTAIFDPGTNYNGGVDTSYLILYETIGVIAPVGTSEKDIEAMLSCAASVQFTEDYIAKSKAASDAQLATVTEQLSRNRAIIDSLVEGWLGYIKN